MGMLLTCRPPTPCAATQPPPLRRAAEGPPSAALQLAARSLCPPLSRVGPALRSIPLHSAPLVVQSGLNEVPHTPLKCAHRAGVEDACAVARAPGADSDASAVLRLVARAPGVCVCTGCGGRGKPVLTDCWEG
eukprot:1155975-Pelagomonas_calceolata.AAC.5